MLERLRVTFGDNLLHGFSLISLDARSTFVVAANVLLLLTSSVVCHKDRGPILFIIYTADLASIVAQHGLSLH